MSDKMKLLQINAVYGVGSTGVIVRDIHELCLKEGMDAHVAYSTSPIPEAEISGGYAIGNSLGKKLHALFCRVNGMQSYFSRFSTYQLLKHIKKINPDIVQLHNLHSNYIHLNLLLKFLAKEQIKTVITLHDCWFYTGGCFHYTAEGCDRWLTACGDCPKKNKDTRAWLFDRSARILRDRKKYLSAIEDLTVVGVSDWIAGEARKTFLKDKRVVTVHNGVDTEVFKPTPSTLREKYGIKDKFVILGLASKFLSPVNQETFEKVSNSLTEDEVLLLLGCTEEQKTRLPQGVIPLPFIKDRTELCQMYSMADVFVNVTREDTFPTANLEPQACGTPVITYHNTGAGETVDNRCGFPVETGNAEELLARIRHVKQTGKPAFEEDCRKWAVSQFDKEKNYQKYIRIFAEKSGS